MAQGQSTGEDAAEGVPAPSPARPRVVIRADLLPAVSVLSTVSLLGIPLGWLWSRLAPPEQERLQGGRTAVVLPSAMEHRFDALAVFVLLTAAAGILVGAAVWLLRGRRGPVALVATVLGACVAAWLTLRLGVSFAGGLYPMPAGVTPGALVTRPPRLETALAVLVAPMAAALAYGLAAAWNGTDDLGRRLG